VLGGEVEVEVDPGTGEHLTPVARQRRLREPAAPLGAASQSCLRGL
jgi:hypothetical protein